MCVISISTVALYLAVTCPNVWNFCYVKSPKIKQIFLYAFISVVRISFCSVFISSDMFATAFINSYLLMLILYSYCRDLFYLYCKIPNNFGQGRNMAGRIYFISNTTRYHRLKTNRCENRTLHFYIEEEKMLISSRFSIISSQLFAIYISIFHKTEVLTVILRCWTGLNHTWFKSYDKKRKWSDKQ